MLNHITIMGRLTRDPELKTTPTDTPVATFTLAVDRDFGADRQADFIDCVAFGKTAEFIGKHFTKGRMAVADGRLRIRDWTGKDGTKRRSAEVIIDNVYFGDSKPASAASAEPPVFDIVADEEELPF